MCFVKKRDIKVNSCEVLSGVYIILAIICIAGLIYFFGVWIIPLFLIVEIVSYMLTKIVAELIDKYRQAKLERVESNNEKIQHSG